MNISGELEQLITEHGSAKILRERLELAKDQYTDLEKKVSTLQSENESLCKQLDLCQKENQSLKKLVEKQPGKTSDFDETTHRILKIFFDRSEDISVDLIVDLTGFDRGIVQYHLDLLRDSHFILPTRMGTMFSPPLYGITSNGRKYIVKNKI